MTAWIGSTGEKNVICVIIQAEQSDGDRAGKLMEILEQVDDSYLPQFYDALNANNQTDVIQLMNFKGLYEIQHKL